MRTLLYTGYDKAYNKLVDITVPRMKEYAEYHGYAFRCYTEPLIDVPNGIYWTGVCGALKAFEDGYDRTIYLDVDQLITNDEFSFDDTLTNFHHGLHAPRDWGEDAKSDYDISACCLIAHRDSIPILQAVLKAEPEWRDKPFPEQGPLRENFQAGFDVPFRWPWPRKPFNCVPDAVCPGKVPEPWQPVDFAAHLTMLPIEDRVKLAKEILAKL
jgi:hypothetical protein